ncbi:glycoside hydrolase family 3 N-terminal domain-containing protein [Magnetococcus sp. PR-3]|uniref:glycoside hydrolase family 3 N-terminal domain-containing protein n=1 Tax=Magnetococcus sp. PR-3 TaxID=3120355 RepID=UPI002FCE21E2
MVVNLSRIVLSVLICLVVTPLYATPDSQTDIDIDALVKNMSIKELIGQKIILGPPWFFPEEELSSDSLKKASKQSDQQLSTLINAYKIGNFSFNKKAYWIWHSKQHRRLFKRSLTEKENSVIKKQWKEETLRELSSRIQDLSAASINIPALIMTDFEGGRVQTIRFKNVNNTPSPMAMSVKRDDTSVKKMGWLVGETLRELGITNNFAPVVDLNQQGSVIGTRSFSSDEKLVTQYASAYLDGLNESGIGGTLKHWPGHGKMEFPTEWDNLNIDFHMLGVPLTLPVSRDDLTTFSKPYKEILQTKNRRDTLSIMTSHIIVDAFGHDQAKPSCLTMITRCKNAIDYLRKDLSFQDGVVIADDIVFLRSTHAFKLLDIMVDTFESGHDMIIISSMFQDARGDGKRGAKGLKWKISPEELMETLDKLYKHYENKEGELRASVKRILRMKLAIMNKLGHTNWDEPYQPNTFQSPPDYITGKDSIEVVSNQVLKNAIVHIFPSNEEPRTLAKRLNIMPDSKIFCVGPTYQKNDLEAQLRRLANFSSASQIECVDLHYNKPGEMNDHFVDKNTKTIIDKLKANPPDLLIFGVANFAAHIEVWNRVSKELATDPSLKKRLANTKKMVVAFHDPSRLSNSRFRRGWTMLSTFSNSTTSNQYLVEALLDKDHAATIKEAKYLPVAVHPVHTKIKLTSGDNNPSDVPYSYLFGILFGTVISLVIIWVTQGRPRLANITLLIVAIIIYVLFTNYGELFFSHDITRFIQAALLPMPEWIQGIIDIQNPKNFTTSLLLVPIFHMFLEGLVKSLSLLPFLNNRASPQSSS